MTEPHRDRDLLVLERARRGLAPSAAQRRSTLQRLGATLALTPAASNASAAAPPSRPLRLTRPPATFSLRTLVAGVVSGVLAGYGGAHIGASDAAAPSSQPAPRAPVASAGRGPAPLTSGGAVTPAPDLPAREEIAQPPPATSAETPLASPARPRRAPEPSGSAQAADFDELSYVRRAQTALRNGNGALALGLMRSVDELAPRGALLAERAVVRVLALCQLGRQDEARSAATLATKAGDLPDVYRRRMHNSCAGEAPSE